MPKLAALFEDFRNFKMNTSMQLDALNKTESIKEDPLADFQNLKFTVNTLKSDVNYFKLQFGLARVQQIEDLTLKQKDFTYDLEIMKTMMEQVAMKEELQKA